MRWWTEPAAGLAGGATGAAPGSAAPSGRSGSPASADEDEGMDVWNDTERTHWNESRSRQKPGAGERRRRRKVRRPLGPGRAFVSFCGLPAGPRPLFHSPVSDLILTRLAAGARTSAIASATLCSLGGEVRGCFVSLSSRRATREGPDAWLLKGGRFWEVSRRARLSSLAVRGGVTVVDLPRPRISPDQPL